ncbi:MAG: hypothetical protein RLZZ450_7735, partial [Pseudomonadota bacterium]
MDRRLHSRAEHRQPSGFATHWQGATRTDSTLVERSLRCRVCGLLQSAPPLGLERDLEQLADHKRRSRELRGRNRAIAACPAARPFLENIALHGGHLG